MLVKLVKMCIKLHVDSLAAYLHVIYLHCILLVVAFCHGNSLLFMFVCLFTVC